jgi:hypothetical protein
MGYTSVDEIRKANRAAGHRWFMPEEMECFHTTVYPVVYGGHYFVTSEREPDSQETRFTVRYASDDGVVRSHGGFFAWASWGEAAAMASACAEECSHRE